MNSLESLRLVNPKGEGKFYNGFFGKIELPNLKSLSLKFEKYDPSLKAWLELFKLFLGLRKLKSLELELYCFKADFHRLFVKTLRVMSSLSELKLRITNCSSISKSDKLLEMLYQLVMANKKLSCLDIDLNRPLTNQEALNFVDMLKSMKLKKIRSELINSTNIIPSSIRRLVKEKLKLVYHADIDIKTNNKLNRISEY